MTNNDDAKSKDTPAGADAVARDSSTQHANDSDAAVSATRNRRRMDSSADAPLKVVSVRPDRLSDDDLTDEMRAPTPRPLRTTEQDPYVGCVIDGRYRVEAVLGEGGMGVVYACKHKVIGKKVAMKVLRADLARDREVTNRFLNEARAASAIGSPHIIDISDFGRFPDGSTYFVMEHLDGVPLSHVIEPDQPLPLQRILHIARQLAEGLAAAHSADIVHRDLKPDNIFLVQHGTEKDFVKILDFGIAKVSSAEGRLTRAGTVFGTPHYMSPEQAAGTSIDQRGDIYSFGVILYEMTSGRVPFDADNFMGILTQHMYKSPIPIRALVTDGPEVPAGLEAIILKCLSKRPEQRYQSMLELLSELRKVEAGLAPDAVSEMSRRSGSFEVPVDYFQQHGLGEPSMDSPLPDVRNRWPLYAGVAGVLAAIAIVVAIFAHSSSGGAATRSAGASGTSTSGASLPAAPIAPEARSVSTGQEDARRRQVVLAVEPLDAQVFKDGRDLGASPVFVDLTDQQPVSLEIRRSGYKTRTVTVDGSQPRISVRLDRGGAATGTPKSNHGRRGAKRSPMGTTDIVDPWSR